MAQVKPYRNDTDGFPIEIDTDNDDLTLNSLTVDSGVEMGSSKITGLAPGTLATDAVNKSQLDSVAAGFDPKGSCRVKTAASKSTWTASGSGVGKTLTSPNDNVSNNDFDGVTLAVGNRICWTFAGASDLLADVDNGIYEMTTLADGAGQNAVVTRVADADEDAEVTAGMFCFVSEGTAHADTGWFVETNDPITVDTTPIAWTQFAGVGTFTGGDGIDISSGVVSVDLGTDPGLEFVSNQLEVLVDPAGAIEKAAAGIGINLEASNPSLQISGNELGIKFDPAGALEKTAAGTRVKVDGSTISIIGNELVAAAAAKPQLNAGTGGVTIGDPVYVSANDTGLPCDNTDNNTRLYAGVAGATVGVGVAFDVLNDGDVVTPASIDGSPAAGDVVWQHTSGLTVNLPTGSGTHRRVIGKMKNATEVLIDSQYIVKL